MYHENVNVSSIVENVTRIKIGITINVGASVKLKKTSCAKDYIFAILLHEVVKMVIM